MKSEERHELKTNELLYWLEHFPQWAKENRNNIIIAAAVIVLAAGVGLYWLSLKRTTIEEQTRFTALVGKVQQNTIEILRGLQQDTDVSYSLLKTADELGGFAEQTKNPQMAAIAYIEKGGAIRMELHYRQSAISPSEKQLQIEKAKLSYQNALGKAAGNNELAAKAKLGLGLCEEEMGNFDTAKAIYQELASKTEYAQTLAGKQASQRLEVVGSYQKEIAFTPSPKKPVPAIENENVFNMKAAPAANPAPAAKESNSPMPSSK
jgi:tetratricopeptide (TPR) repeat protein